MKFIRKNFILLIVAAYIIYLYLNWFTKGELTAFDFPYLYINQLNDYSWLPYSWSSLLNVGLGGNTIRGLSLDTYVHLGIRLFVFTFHIPWSITYRLLFFWPFLIIGFISSFYFCLYLLKNRSYAAFGTLVYLSNTYVLMLAGGGQVGLMMAYAMAPAVIASFLKRNKIIFTITLFLLIFFDLRFSLLVFGILLLSWIFIIPINKWIIQLKFNIMPFLLLVGLNSFWIIQTIFYNSSLLPEGYDNPDWLKFLSWASLPNAISLLHPNWPENIFGKTYFMKPEFLIIPLIGFIPLIFVKLRNNISGLMLIESKYVVFYLFIALIGAFFAKGVNPPFENVYKWFFNSVPLFNGFRDPTKFYLLISLAFCYLIPQSLMILSKYLSSWRRISHITATSLIIILFTGYWSYLIFPQIQRETGGTFKKIIIPQDYEKLHMLIFDQKEFSRTLTVPWSNRFIYNSVEHPILSASNILQTTDITLLLQAFKNQNTENIFKLLAIKYVIVPDDFTNEIFINDRKYDPAIKQKVINMLDSLPYLIKLSGSNEITIYEYINFSGHFFSITNNNEYETYDNKRKNPVQYNLSITNSTRPITIIFSESFDSGWKLWDGQNIISSIKTSSGLNSFDLLSSPTSQVMVYYSYQKLLIIGYIISFSTIFIFIYYWYFRKFRKQNINIALIFVIVAIFGIYFFLPLNNIDYIINNKYDWDPQSRKILNEELIQDDYVFNYYLFPEQYSSNEIMRSRCFINLSVCDSLLRELQIKLPKKENKKIAILGDSISVIYGKMNYSYILSDWLGYDIQNASVLGSSVSISPLRDAAIKRYRNDISIHKPEIILINIGTNDLIDNVPLSTFQENYAQLIKNIKAENTQSSIFALGINYWTNMDNNNVVKFNEIIQQTAVNNQIYYVYPYDYLKKDDLEDDVHPSLLSQVKIAKKLDIFIRIKLQMLNNINNYAF